MSSTWGKKIKISIFGESHGNGIGVVIDGLPSGFTVDMNAVLKQMARRAPGNDKTATPRKESDTPNILSGLLNNVTTGAPLCAVINNNNTKSTDYSNLLDCPRPGHSDYCAYVKYNGFNDISGGGHFSGRITAPIVFAGAICRQILHNNYGINIAAHISNIGNIFDADFNSTNTDLQLLNRLNSTSFSVINENIEEKMREEVESARMECDSVGGSVECMVAGLNAGIGEPMFGGVEGVISSIIFGIPAVKGIEFGKGFELAKMRGSKSNDPFMFKDSKVVTTTNNCGGILGGITNGMPVVFKVAIKPTPSISKEQDTVNLQTKQNAKLIVNGRHDPCIVPRAVPVIEAATAIAIINMI